MNKISAYTFIVYSSDVGIDTLVHVLDIFGYPYVISPLHDKDLHTKGQKKGQYKDPHYHIMIQHKVKESIQHRINNALGIRENMPWFAVRDMCGLFEYFYHENELEKAHYDENDMIISDNFNMDFSSYASSKRQYDIDAIKLIYELNFIDFDAFIKYLLGSDLDLLHYVSNKAYFFISLIDSRRYNLKKKDGKL